jgi:hypothetical protein
VQESIFFHKGLSYDTRSVLQQPGFLKTAQNVLFEVEGNQTLRPMFSAINATAVNALHSIKRFRDRLLVGDSTYLRERSATAIGDFTSLGSSFANAIWNFREYKNFLHGVNGTDGVLFDEDGNLYPSQISNPSSAPSGAAGAVGNPNGHYMLYVSFFITWPNGQTYETGLSAASADVSVSSQAISWSSIPTCSYAAYYGTAPTIYRKLYRGPGTGGTLADIYYVATISDNTTTTYTDDATDATLAANGACYVDDYDAAPDGAYIEYHYGRLYLIHATYTNRLYWSESVAGETGAENEALMPLAVLADSWDDLRVSGLGKVDPQGLIAWGGNLYIPMKHTWLRKQGEDPDSWSYKKTWASHGIGAPQTICISSSPSGIVGLTSPISGTPGLSLFNGQTVDIFTTPRFDYIFNEHMDHDYIHKCRGAIIGRDYHLLYPSSGQTEPDTHIVFDMRRFPDVRVATWTALSGRSLDVDTQGKRFYIGGSDGYARQEATSGEVIDAIVETHDMMGGDPKLANIIKSFQELRYALNSGGSDVTMEVYIDDTLQTWPDGTTSKTITGTGEAVQYIRAFPVNWKGYKMRIKLTAADMSTFEIYSPWQLSFEATA